MNASIPEHRIQRGGDARGRVRHACGRHDGDDDGARARDDGGDAGDRDGYARGRPRDAARRTGERGARERAPKG